MPFKFGLTFSPGDKQGKMGAASSPKPVVTGGTLTSDATYYYRTFSTNGTLGIADAPLIADVLVVGGGGGGGYRGQYYDWSYGYINQGGGGGGGGGVTNASAVTLDADTYSITVGAGGNPIDYGGFSRVRTSGGVNTFFVFGGEPGLNGGSVSGGNGGQEGSYAYAGGSGANRDNYGTPGGGGGGAGHSANGDNAYIYNGGAGGAGVTIDGVTYSEGGYGGTGGNGTGTAPSTSAPGCGAGGANGNGTPGIGKPGIVIVKYTKAQVD